jgi:hypothetical protein
VYCHDATVSSFVARVQCEVFTHFHAVAVKHHSSMRNWLFGHSGWILWEPLDDEDDEHTLEFTLYLSRLFSVSVSLDFPCTAHAFFP